MDQPIDERRKKSKDDPPGVLPGTPAGEPDEAPGILPGTPAEKRDRRPNPQTE